MRSTLATARPQLQPPATRAARAGTRALAAQPPPLTVDAPLSHVMAGTSPCSEGGMFKATMEFPQDYPNMPPTLKFDSEFWHPNVHEDGKVCIS